MRKSKHALLGAAVGALLTGFLLPGGGPARAEVSLNWRGYIEADLRFFTHADADFDRLEGTGGVRLSARLSDHVLAVGDLKIVFTERGQPATFSALTDRTLIDPLRFESDALFVEFIDVGIEGFDIRIGRQQVIWGSGDRFNPTSNLNPLDVEDSLSFGQVVANEMVRLAFRPDITGDEDDPIFSDFYIELVWVPFFKPAQLPNSAGLAFTDRSEFKARADTPLLARLVQQQQVLVDLGIGWSFDYHANINLPSRNLKNSMYAARVGWNLGGVDMAFSYFNGYDDFPRAEYMGADVQGIHADIDIQLTYPHMHVLGIQMATSLDFLDGLGLWGEVAITFHDELFQITDTGAIGVNDIGLEFDAGVFAKATVGIDYTPVPWCYFNIQYLHGFVDEFGARKLGNYLVPGIDFKIGQETVLIRLFGIVSLDDGSFVLFPSFIFKPWDAGEIQLGAFLFSSVFTGYDPFKKFEARSAGTSSVFLKAKAYF